MNDAHILRGEPLWGRAMATAVDRLTSERFLIPSLVLMENAGRLVATVLQERMARRDTLEHAVLVLAGPGNNGGDALVAARYLLEAGVKVHVVSVLPFASTKPSPSCALQSQILGRLGHPVFVYSPGDLKVWSDSLPCSHVWVIDGILGLGGRPDIAANSVFGTALREVALFHEKTVVAVDVPSGFDPDDGTQKPVWLQADITITCGGRKPAQVLSPARDQCGELIPCEIGFPHLAVELALEEHPALWWVPDTAKLVDQNPWKALGPSTHKYERGHVLIIGGSAGKTGAPLLSAMSALRCGAGWATVAMPKAAMDSLRGDVPREIVFESLFSEIQGGEELISPERLKAFLSKARVRAVVVGPGTMVSPLARDTMTVLSDFCIHGGSVVFDAGACHNLIPLLEDLEGPRPPAERWVMTPHPGEWVKLGLDKPRPPLTVEAHTAISALAERLSITVLYKNATPVLFTGKPGSPAFVSTEGSKILARAGSGDILAGVVGAHGARRVPADIGTMRGQAVIARAARRASARLGEDSVLAQDIIEELGRSTV